MMQSQGTEVAIQAWFRRISALIQRERISRFSGGALGYLWAYITPIFWIVLVVFLFYILDRSPPIYVSAEIFVATGILPYIAFRNTIGSVTRAGVAHRYMLYLQPTSISDIMVAVGLLELFNILLSALVIFGFLTLWLGLKAPHDPAVVLWGLAINWMLGVSIGRFFGILGLVSDSIARVVPLALRPTFWLSGIFFTATELPGAVQAALWWSPTLHATEIMREGYFLSYISPIASASYPLFVAGMFYIAAVPLEFFATRRRLLRYRL